MMILSSLCNRHVTWSKPGATTPAPRNTPNTPDSNIVPGRKPTSSPSSSTGCSRSDCGETMSATGRPARTPGYPARYYEQRVKGTGFFVGVLLFFGLFAAGYGYALWLDPT